MGDIRPNIRFLRGDKLVCLDQFLPRTMLLDYLRTVERSVGTKEGCAEGDCGACTVVLGRLKRGRVTYEAVNSCVLLLGQVDGAQLLTVENLGSKSDLHPVQTEMVDHHGSQCGFCTPGIVMSLFAFYQEASRPVAREDVLDALAGNLCRCTGYKPIVQAGLKACATEPTDWHAGSATQLAQLADDRNVVVGDDTSFFAAPSNEDDLAELYAQHPDARLVGGCTDVGLWVTKSLNPLQKIIWLGRIDSLTRIENLDGELILGAGVTLSEALAPLACVDRDLGELVRRFGSPQVRAVGTVGGNIANGSPIGDLAPALIALDATLDLRRGNSTRNLPLEQFFIEYRKQDRQPGEYLQRLRIPKFGADQAFRCFKVSKRFDEDISAVMGAFLFALEDGHIVTARIAFGGMAGIPKRATRTEAALVGVSLKDASSWEPALQKIADDYQPITDQRATAAYRTLVGRNLLKKTLLELSSAGPAETRLVSNRGETVTGGLSHAAVLR